MREININMSVGVRGMASITPRGEPKKRFVPNTVTNYGLSEIVYSLLDKALPQYYMATGGDNTELLPEEIALQTQLKDEIVRVAGLEVGSKQETDLNYSFNLLAPIEPQAGDPLLVSPPLEFKEVGLFNRYKDGVMFARTAPDAEFSYIVGLTYDGDWKIIFDIGQDVISNGGIVRSGSKILARAIARFNPESVSNGYWINLAHHPQPFGINLISLGTSTTPTVIDQTDLWEPLFQFDTPPTITSRDDMSLEATDENYDAFAVFQKYIPPNTINQDISEIGLFNHQHFRDIQASANTINNRNMFSRNIIFPAIPANEEAVITWKVHFKRG